MFMTAKQHKAITAVKAVIKRLDEFKPCKTFNIDCGACRYGALLKPLLEDYLDVLLYE
jgi:hypothetical protein